MDLTNMFALCWLVGAAIFAGVWVFTRRLRPFPRLTLRTLVAAVILCPGIVGSSGGVGVCPWVVALFLQPEGWRLHCMVLVVFFGIMLACAWSLKTLATAIRPLCQKGRR
jgi:hypothetical protein